MFDTLKTAAIAATLSIGALVAAAPAQADSVGFHITDGDTSVGVRFGDDRPRYDDRRGGWDRADWDGDRRGGWDRDRWDRPSCQPWRAVDKARRMGVRHARVVDVDRGRIVVRGNQYGDRVRVIFGRAPNCPVRGVY